jgi:hypothetical protein
MLEVSLAEAAGTAMGAALSCARRLDLLLLGCDRRMRPGGRGDRLEQNA